jgi:hypothetical protein
MRHQQKGTNGNMENKIDITGVNLREFIKAAYDLSRPQGLGFIHARSGPLADEVVDEILKSGGRRHAARMDYVLGRAVKMNIFDDDGQLTIHDTWYDHTPEDLDELLSRCGITR